MSTFLTMLTWIRSHRALGQLVSMGNFLQFAQGRVLPFDYLIQLLSLGA